jgi:hypothetical protein
MRSSGHRRLGMGPLIAAVDPSAHALEWIRELRSQGVFL